MTADRVSLRIENNVADVKLVRSDKMNALDLPMFHAIVEVGEALKKRNDIRAVVLSGEGRSFCSGLDVLAIQSAGGFDALANRYGDANLAQYVATIWRDIPVPVVAALHGVVYGGGFQICLGADMRFVAPDTRLSIMEIKWGLVPDMAGNLFMHELAKTDVIRELTFTGRVFSGEEAFKFGFATKVCSDPYAEAHTVALEIASKSPDAVRGAKRLANLSRSLSRHDLLLKETEEQLKVVGTVNQIEASIANLEKRIPQFVDPS